MEFAFPAYPALLSTLLCKAIFMDSGITDGIAKILDKAKSDLLALLSDAPVPKESAAPLLTARDIAKRLQVNTQAVYRLAREGKLPAVKLGSRTLRWSEDVVMEFVSRRGVEDQANSKPLRLLQAKR